MERCCGILLHLSSLPSPYGIGTMGRAAYNFVDFLSSAGQSLWQLLPLGPTSCGDSPYQSFSSFAGNPYFIDLDMLVEDGLLLKSELDGIDWGENPEFVDYGKIYENRFKVLKIAAERGIERDKAELERFVNDNRSWLPDYALFMALKRHFGMKAWFDWPDEALRRHESAALEHWRVELAEDVAFHAWMQQVFFAQWAELKAYVNGLGIRIIGDLPIYVSLDSADVWSERKEFLLDSEGRPSKVAGVPPDYFSEDGQLWGNPLYDWNRMKDFIPGETPVSELALQFDVYVPEPWNLTGQMEITLQNNLSNWGYGSDCTKPSEKYTNQATVWIPWLQSDGTTKAFTTGDRWVTVTIPLTKFGNYSGDDDAHTFQNLIDDRNSGSYRNFGFMFVNSDIVFNNDLTISALDFSQKIYVDNFRIVPNKSTIVSDYPEE